MPQPDPSALLFGAYRRQILGLLLTRPGQSFHVREIARLTGVPAGSLHRELKALAEAGILRRMPAENHVHYAADTRCPIFQELAGIFSQQTSAARLALKAAESPAAYSVTRAQSLRQRAGQAAVRKKTGQSEILESDLGDAVQYTQRLPRCIVIAGPNGAGKTTFAQEYLLRDARVVRFVNADLLAAGLSPLKPGLAALASARLVLAELDRLAEARADFAFESTLSGLAYLGLLKRWKQAGYFIKIVYLKLDSPALALKRIAMRVRQGGHDVPRPDVIRRFSRSLDNFQSRYRLLADTWELYDNSGERPQLLETGP